MIPKIIHLCWFSGDKYPPLINYCIKSWKKFLPDYKIKVWNYDSFPPEKSIWVRQALENKKYAFAADYIRAYALYTEGGIYLDSDVEVIKDFGPLLDRKYFIGSEAHNLVEAAVMGAEKGFPLFKKLLDYYDSREFVKADGCLDMLPMPKIIEKIINTDYKVKKIDKISDQDPTDGLLEIFPSSFFSPKAYLTGELNVTEETFCIHHFDGGWLNRWEKAYRWVKNHFGAIIADSISRLVKSLVRYHK